MTSSARSESLLAHQVSDEPDQGCAGGHSDLEAQAGGRRRPVEAAEAVGLARVGDDPHRSPEPEPVELDAHGRR